MLTMVEFREALQASLADERMSLDERSAFTEALRQFGGDPGKLKQARAAAFEVARDALGKTPPARVLAWLENAIRAIESSTEQPIEVRCLFAPRDPCVDEICALLREARETADLCIFTITDDRIVNEIEDAHRRGVRVRILTDDDKAHDRGSDIHRLARAGIQVRKDHDPAHMHHKFAIIDGHWLLTGSYNWTRSASKENAENVIILDHTGACAQFMDEFERLWRLSRR